MAHTNLHPDLLVHLSNLLRRVIRPRLDILGRSNSSLVLLLLLLHLHHCGRRVVVGHFDVVGCAAREVVPGQRGAELLAAEGESREGISLPPKEGSNRDFGVDEGCLNVDDAFSRSVSWSGARDQISARRRNRALLQAASRVWAGFFGGRNEAEATGLQRISDRQAGSR